MVRMAASTILRRKVLATIALVVLVGVAGGAVLAATAGARRTERAYGRFLDEVHAADVIVAGQGFGVVDAASIRPLPHVDKTVGLAGFGLANRPAAFGMPTGSDADFSAAPIGGRFAYEIDGARLLDGRLPRLDAVDEIFVNEIFSEKSGLGVGDTFEAMIIEFDEFDALNDRLEAEQREPTVEELHAALTPVDLHITGVGRSPTDLLTDDESGEGVVILTPAFAQRYEELIGYQIVVVRLDDPADLGAFSRAARRAFPDEGIDLQVPATGAALFAQGTQPYVDALQVFALVAGLTALFVVGQAILRTVGTDARDRVQLEALGAVRRERAAVAGARSMLVAWSGATLAVLVAILLSPVFPLGRARDAEPSTGIRVDGTVLLVGFVLIGVLLSLLATGAAWRAARSGGADEARPWRPSTVAARLARAGAPATAVTGVRSALQRGRGVATPSFLTTLVGLVAAITTLTATVVFAANLDRLVVTPTAYGWSWDALIDTGDNGVTDQLTADVLADREFTDVSVASRANLELDGRSVGAFGFASERGNALPEVTDGRRPRGGREVALGSRTMRELGVSIGDRVTANTPAGEQIELHVVGRSVFPGLALNESTAINDSAMVTAAAMRRLDAAIRPSFYLVDLRSGAARSSVAARYSSTTVVTAFRPGEIQSYSRVRSTPAVLAALLALLGVGVLAHLLGTSVRARRRELALLKTLGFTRRQVASSVAWQSTVLALVPLAIGVPLGLVAGRWFWRRLSGSLGIADALVVPAFAVAAVVVATLLLANVIAALPARSAARTRPAVVLRSE